MIGYQGTAFYNEWLYTEKLQVWMEGKRADFGGILIIDTLDWASFLIIRFHVKAAIFFETNTLLPSKNVNFS